MTPGPVEPHAPGPLEPHAPGALEPHAPGLSEPVEDRPTRNPWLRVALAALLCLAACTFEPDLSRYAPCDAQGRCPTRFTCLREAARCVPACDDGDCETPDAGAPDAGPGDAGPDAGADAGLDAGATEDAGPALALAAMTLTPAIETKPYAVQLAPTGGTPPYAFFLDGGVPGFSLETNGTFRSQAATTPGTFTFEVTVSDDAQPRARVTQGYTLEVQKLLRVASHTLLEGRSGQPYAAQLAATGGTGPFSWSTDGGLPAGLSLTTDGLVQGTPSGTTGGSVRTFTIDVIDSSSPPQRASRQVGVQVKALDTVLVIATPAAADGRAGEPYAQTLKAYGGTPPYAWTLASGALPPGVTIVNSGTVGQLGGTPTDAGTYSFTVRCSDGLTSPTQSLSIVVY